MDRHRPAPADEPDQVHGRGRQRRHRRFDEATLWHWLEQIVVDLQPSIFGKVVSRRRGPAHRRQRRDRVRRRQGPDRGSPKFGDEGGGARRSPMISQCLLSWRRWFRQLVPRYRWRPGRASPGAPPGATVAPRARFVSAARDGFPPRIGRRSYVAGRVGSGDDPDYGSSPAPSPWCVRRSATFVGRSGSTLRPSRRAGSTQRRTTS